MSFSIAPSQARRRDRTAFYNAIQLPEPDNIDAVTVLGDLYERDLSEEYMDLEDELESLSEKNNPSPGPLRNFNRLLGYPYQRQSEMQSDCQLRANGFDYGVEHDEARVQEVLRDATEWRLLLQLDSDDDMGWAGDGFAYYWIRRSDLNARRFSETWIQLQR